MPYAKSIVGIDISQKMVDEYNRRVANQGLSSEEMHAVRADVLSSSCEELRRMKGSFDVVVVSSITTIELLYTRWLISFKCSASYHHLDDIVSTTQALGCFLKPGGSLLVIDLLKDQNLNVDEIFPEHERHDIVAHRGGFSQHEIKEAFDAAGLSSFVFTDGIKAKKSGQPVTLFIARGVLKQP
jgi:SAM-dependent methyltransferase